MWPKLSKKYTSLLVALNNVYYAMIRIMVHISL